jgi:putative ABC transport system substrate-binding protein
MPPVLQFSRTLSHSVMRDMLAQTEVAARKHGVQLQRFEVRTVTELDDAFLAIHAARADALILFPSLMLFPARERIVDLAAKHRLPTMYISREFVQLGGFIAYGINFPNTFRRAAAYVDQILKGAKPADLPVEQPTKFELVINLKTAKALGLTIPPSLLSRADEVID